MINGLLEDITSSCNLHSLQLLYHHSSLGCWFQLDIICLLYSFHRTREVMKRSLSFSNILSLTEEVTQSPDVRKVRSCNFVHSMNVANFEFDIDEWERVDIEHNYQSKVNAQHDTEQRLSALFAVAATDESVSSGYMLGSDKLVVNATNIRKMISAQPLSLDACVTCDSKQESHQGSVAIRARQSSPH